jgi:hypothetical protein
LKQQASLENEIITISTIDPAPAKKGKGGDEKDRPGSDLAKEIFDKISKQDDQIRELARELDESPRTQILANIIGGVASGWRALNDRQKAVESGQQLQQPPVVLSTEPGHVGLLVDRIVLTHKNMNRQYKEEQKARGRDRRADGPIAENNPPRGNRAPGQDPRVATPRGGDARQVPAVPPSRPTPVPTFPQGRKR